MPAFRILVLGDFGAAAAPPRPLLVDRDNLDQIIARLDVRCGSVAHFHELEDFHPDRLFQSVDLFRGLRDLRANAANPEAFRETALDLLSARPSEPDARAAAVELSSGSLLDDIVSAAAPARKADALQKYINAVVAPYIEPRADPKQEEMLAEVDAAAAGQMRALLHNRRFQEIESAWRALDFLVRNTETDEDLKISILQAPKKSVAAELLAASDLRVTSLYRVLVEETVGTPGGEPWALVAANYTIGPGDEDVEFAARMALLAAAAGCPVIARADAALLADAAELGAWNELRSIPEARYLGLALPGFLLRLPYGKDTSPTELFPLEEMPGNPKHSDYLWGNPSFACALLTAEAFAQSGWDMRPGDALDISGLPAHVYKKDGESVMKPCAEVLMTESEAEALMERGLIPLLSMKNSDRVRVAGFRSIAGTPLAGRWR